MATTPQSEFCGSRVETFVPWSFESRDHCSCFVERSVRKAVMTSVSMVRPARFRHSRHDDFTAVKIPSALGRGTSSGIGGFAV